MRTPRRSTQAAGAVAAQMGGPRLVSSDRLVQGRAVRLPHGRRHAVRGAGAHRARSTGHVGCVGHAAGAALVVRGAGEPAGGRRRDQRAERGGVRRRRGRRACCCLGRAWCWRACRRTTPGSTC
eukprot:366350-Chlamydomonas_euryale.AAC.18